LLEDQVKKTMRTFPNAVKLSWKDLSYTIKVKSKKSRFCKKSMEHMTVLKNTQGYCMPGTTTYILGASGAGKTSLLNCLSDRHESRIGMLKGDIMLNDKKLGSGAGYHFGSVGVYVMQDDILYTHMTVKEAFTFSARLKLVHLSKQ